MRGSGGPASLCPSRPAASGRGVKNGPDTHRKRTVRPHQVILALCHRNGQQRAERELAPFSQPLRLLSCYKISQEGGENLIRAHKPRGLQTDSGSRLRALQDQPLTPASD